MKHIFLLAILLLGCSLQNNQEDQNKPPSINDLEKVTDLRVNALSFKYILIEWTDNSNREEGYIIERSLIQDFSSINKTYKVELVDSNGTPKDGLDKGLEYFGDFDIKPGTDYYYRIRSFNRNGNESVWVTADSVTVPEVKYATDTIRILFVGNSGFSYNKRLHNWVQELDSLFPDSLITFTDANFHGGGGLMQHYQDIIEWEERVKNNPDDAEIAPLKSVKARFESQNYGYYDYVILQEFYVDKFTKNELDQPVNDVHDSSFWKYLDYFIDLAEQHGTEPVLFQYHCVPTYEPQYTDYLNIITQSTETAAQEFGIKIINAARAVDLIRFGDDYAGYGISMHYSDGHPSPADTYMFACLLYSCLTGRNVQDLAFPDGVKSFAVNEYGLPKSTAYIIQKAAWEIHKSYD